MTGRRFVREPLSFFLFNPTFCFLTEGTAMRILAIAPVNTNGPEAKSAREKELLKERGG
jgi:hypothetical protein